MEKEFVPYEEALILKELGFNIPSISGYSYFESDKLLVQAILYQQAFRWFREKYGLTQWVIKRKDMEKKYSWYIFNDHPGVGEYLTYDTHFETHEEAELTCLRKLIEIVKNK